MIKSYQGIRVIAMLMIFFYHCYIPDSKVYFAFNGGAWYLSSLLISFLLSTTFYEKYSIFYGNVIS